MLSLKSFFKKYLKVLASAVLRTNNKVAVDTVMKEDINITFIGSVRPQISIGIGTYCNGVKIYCWDCRIKLNIGKYCSIADNIVITAGGEHEKEWVSTYPFTKKYHLESLYETPKKRYKGDIIIGNDVWVANNVSILSGVTIGNGAVIGAGSIVVKNVEAYSIVAGNPARHIKYRFTPDQIEKLELVGWWDWELSKILDNVHLFSEIDSFLLKHHKPQN